MMKNLLRRLIQMLSNRSEEDILRNSKRMNMKRLLEMGEIEQRKRILRKKLD